MKRHAPTARITTFKRLCAAREKQQMDARASASVTLQRRWRAVRTRRQRTTPQNSDDPFTLEPLDATRRQFVHVSADGSAVHAFDAEQFARYMLSTARFENPFTRAPLHDAELARLDRCNARDATLHVLPRRAVLEQQRRDAAERDSMLCYGSTQLCDAMHEITAWLAWRRASSMSRSRALYSLEQVHFPYMLEQMLTLQVYLQRQHSRATERQQHDTLRDLLREQCVGMRAELVRVQTLDVVDTDLLEHVCRFAQDELFVVAWLLANARDEHDSDSDAADAADASVAVAAASALEAVYAPDLQDGDDDDGDGDEEDDDDDESSESAAVNALIEEWLDRLAKERPHPRDYRLLLERQHAEQQLQRVTVRTTRALWRNAVLGVRAPPPPPSNSRPDTE